MNISINTKIFGVLGSPIAQSLSPRLHNQLFETYHIDGIYFPFEITSNNLEDLVKGFRLMNLGGFNITKPHKLQIMDYLDEIDPLAQKIGAVNTVVCKEDKLTGYNTDGYGFIKSIENKLKNKSKEDLTVLILGCGGAVKSVSMALAEWNVKKIIIANRTVKKAEDLCRQINETFPQKAQASGTDDNSLEKFSGTADLIINGTSLGMSDSLSKAPLKKDYLKTDHFVYDMIYSPAKTQFLKDAEEKGAIIENGLDMLLYQGLLAFELWTGIFPDPAIGKKILLEGMKA